MTTTLALAAFGTASSDTVAATDIVFTNSAYGSTAEDFNKLLRFDPDLSGSVVAIYTLAVANLTNGEITGALTTIDPEFVHGAPVRRLTQFDAVSGSNTSLIVVARATGSADAADAGWFPRCVDSMGNGGEDANENVAVTYQLADVIGAGNAAGAVWLVAVA